MGIYNLDNEATANEKIRDFNDNESNNFEKTQRLNRMPMEQTLMIVESIQHMEKTISTKLDMILREIEKLDTKLNVKSNELSRISGQLSDHKELLREISIHTRYI